MKLISEMTTAELLAEYNSTTGKSTTKFASRAAGEKAVQKLRDENAAQSDYDYTNIYGFETHKQTNCPHCGVHLSNGVGQHGDDVNGKPLKLNKHQFFCLGCGEEFGPSIKNVAKSVARSTSTSETWNDKAIAAKRSQRHNVNVIFNGGSQAASFRSVRQAFVLLKLPVAKHIPFRMALKKEKSKTFEHDGIVYTFSIESK